MNSQSTSMRLDEFYARHLKPNGFASRPDRDKGAHGRMYIHESTGVMFPVSCDEGAFNISSPRVDTLRKDLARVLAGIKARQAGETELSEAQVQQEEQKLYAGQAGTQRCDKCGQVKPLGDFWRKQQGGRNTTCGACVVAKIREVKTAAAAAHAVERAARAAAELDPHATQVCVGCGQDKPLSAFQVGAAGTRYSKCKVCMVTLRKATMAFNAANAEAEADAAPVTALAALPVAPLDTPLDLRRREIVPLVDFLQVADGTQVAAFVEREGRFVAIRLGGSLYVLTPDGGPGESLTERSAGYIIGLLAGISPATVAGELYY